MKKPKPIKAFAVLDKSNKINAMSIYKDKDLVLEEDEKLALVEISFVKIYK